MGVCSARFAHTCSRIRALGLYFLLGRMLCYYMVVSQPSYAPPPGGATSRIAAHADFGRGPILLCLCVSPKWVKVSDGIEGDSGQPQGWLHRALRSTRKLQSVVASRTLEQCLWTAILVLPANGSWQQIAQHGHLSGQVPLRTTEHFTFHSQYLEMPLASAADIRQLE